MASRHKNKTFATLLASVFGGIGLHRFYIFGKNDRWGWLHAATLPASLLLLGALPAVPWLFSAMLLVLSVLAGFLEALVIGLTPDEKWDARHNAALGHCSDSGWPLVILLVLTMAGGALGTIWVIARSFDLLLTGGAYG